MRICFSQLIFQRTPSMRFQPLCILFLICWLVSFTSNADVWQSDLRFSSGFQPVLWYLDIESRMIGPHQLYFDDLVPEFCLYGDGTLIYRDKISIAAGKWRYVKLNEKEVKDILDETLKS